MTGRMDFCSECRKNAEYTLEKRPVVKTIRDKEYTFYITVAVCSRCGALMNVPGIIDRNVKEIDEQYRMAERLVCVEDIERLMEIYKIGKAPLSLALGFGEITITRYLEGQVPSREYSDIIMAALTTPKYMKEKLIANRSKLTEAAYRKALAAANSMESLLTASDNMMGTIAYIFDRVEEVTPLMLQKLLYFSQGIHMALYGKPIFSEDCRAWIHGPVYQDVYNIFRDFKYDPIEDARFSLLDGDIDILSDEEKRTIELVSGTFGMYGGKILEYITHNEKPWLEARKGYGDGVPSDELIPQSKIMAYYREVHKKYDISTEAGVKKYIKDMIKAIL